MTAEGTHAGEFCRRAFFTDSTAVTCMPADWKMADIEETFEETLGVARKRNAEKKAKTRLEVYRKAPEEARQIAGNDPMRELADWIRNIREREVRPSGRSVLKTGPRSVAVTGRGRLLDRVSERRPHSLRERVTHRG